MNFETFSLLITGDVIFSSPQDEGHDRDFCCARAIYQGRSKLYLRGRSVQPAILSPSGQIVGVGSVVNVAPRSQRLKILASLFSGSAID